ncbi:MAG: TrmH family RNA methyltransferase, partial [Zestosphaera sp.]
MGQQGLRLVLVGPEGRVNMGFILRLARNFGIEDLCVADPQFGLDDVEVREFAARGAELLGKVVVKTSLDECLSGVRLSICTTSIGFLESDVLRQSLPPHLLKYVLPKSGTVALVFGRESVGLRREELEKCDLISSLETGTDYNVLNLSHAVGIYLYELHREEVLEVYERNECTEDVLKALRRELEELKTLSDDEKGVRALKNLVFRANPRNPECGALYRLLKKIIFKLKRPECGD